MNLLTAEQQVAYALGLDVTDTTHKANIDQWLNLSYYDIAGYSSWSWLKGLETVTMATDYTTGTASVAAGGAAVTFSGVIAPSQLNRYIQFSSANDWYKITYHDTGTATATISPAYAQTAALVSGTFKIRTFYYSLASTCEYVVGGRQAITRQPIDIVDATVYDDYKTYTEATGTPTAMILWGQDSAGSWQFTPYPFPDSAVICEFRVIKKATTLSGPTSAPLFPDRFDSDWLRIAKNYGYEFMDDSRWQRDKDEVMKPLKFLKGRDNPGSGQDRVIQAADNKVRGNYMIPFPENFGNVRG
jgi:hypothetical protein